MRSRVFERGSLVAEAKGGLVRGRVNLKIDGVDVRCCFCVDWYPSNRRISSPTGLVRLLQSLTIEILLLFYGHARFATFLPAIL